MRPLRLRTLLLLAACVLGFVTAAATVSLAVLTSSLHRIAAKMSAATESVHVGQELEVRLLLHSRATDGVVMQSLATDIHRALAAAAGHVGSPAEGQSLARVRSRVETYLAARAAGKAADAEVTAAFDAISALLEMNLEDSRELKRSASQWNRLANVVALVVSGVMLLGLPALVVAFRRSVVRPILDIGPVMQRFSAGDHAARVVASGPLELREIAARWNEMAEALERRRQDQLAFLAGVAHDIRNPLGAITLALAQVERPSATQEQRQAATARIKRQVGHLMRMVDDFLDVSQLEAGKLGLRRQAVDLTKLARDVCESFAASSTCHDLLFSATQPEFPLMGDPTRLHQVLSNLVSNAIKYSPDGGLVRVELGSDERGATVLAVSDEGVGISPADQALLFEPFRRVGRTADRIAGRGLGLYVARRIVEAHDGSIEVASAVGRGTTFKLIFPGTARPARGEGTQPAAAPRASEESLN